MTASDYCSSREKTLASRGPSTHEAALLQRRKPPVVHDVMNAPNRKGGREQHNDTEDDGLAVCKFEHCGDRGQDAAEVVADG
jgi:hypothetical protein